MDRDDELYSVHTNPKALKQETMDHTYVWKKQNKHGFADGLK